MGIQSLPRANQYNVPFSVILRKARSVQGLRVRRSSNGEVWNVQGGREIQGRGQKEGRMWARNHLFTPAVARATAISPAHSLHHHRDCTTKSSQLQLSRVDIQGDPCYRLLVWSAIVPCVRDSHATMPTFLRKDEL